MKKARIALLTIAILSVFGTAMAFKAVKRIIIIYFTTTAYNVTATKTLTHAVTTAAGEGEYRYYTLVDNSKATNHSYVTTVII